MKKWRYLISILSLLGLFILPIWAKNLYNIHLFIIICLNIVFAMSLGLILKMGHLSLGHAAYIGIGAYTSALLSVELNIPFWATFFAAGVISALVAFFIGRITLGLKGIYFTITTFSLTEVLRSIWLASKNVFGGASGIMNIPPPFGISSKVHFYYLVLTFMLISSFIFYRLSKSSFGMLCDGLRLNSILEECVGINTSKMKTIVFVIGCTFAGLGGSIFAHYLGHISPANFTMFLSTEIIVYCAIGGLGSILGSAVGGILMTILGESLFGAGFYRSLIFGIILIGFMIFLPSGLSKLYNYVFGRFALNKKSF